MKILLSSYAFAPSIGGLETSSLLLATAFGQAGHQVSVVTLTPGEDQADWPFLVIRQPTARKLWTLVRECQVYFQNNISLRLLWPLLFLRRPLVIAHHTWLSRGLKRFVTRCARNITISQPVADSLPVASDLLGNPFRESDFRLFPDLPRDRDFIYVGRLVTDKGVDLLVSALARLKEAGHRPSLTIVGVGPEEQSLRALVPSLGLQDQVHFAGLQSGETLVQLLNQHRVIVIPSRWREPFGIVALEGLACGCVVVGSDGGGLPEAIGPCGLLFPNGDLPALTRALLRLLQDPSLTTEFQSLAPGHLRRFRPAVVASNYLKVLQEAAARR